MPIEQLKLMRQAGCISIDFAVESGSDVVLKTIKKRMTVEKIERFGMTCHELGIRANFFTMISLPDETREEAAKTFGIIKKLYQYEMRTTIAPLIIYPGLELETIARDRGVMPEGFSWFDRDYRCPYKYISPREYNMPHYLERFSEQDVLDYLEEFRRFASVYTRCLRRNFFWRGGYDGSRRSARVVISARLPYFRRDTLLGIGMDLPSVAQPEKGSLFGREVSGLGREAAFSRRELCSRSEK